VNYSADSTLAGIGGSTDVESKVTPFDSDLTSYNGFVDSQLSPAEPYDGTLQRQYAGKYAFKTIRAMGAIVQDKAVWLSKHYGDWGIYETLVVNKKNS
jgi:hypothetical protein